MTEIIAEIFSKIFNDNVVLATMLVSMIPIMELKGGIPFGMSDAFWGANALGRWQAFWSAYLGCSIVVVVLYFAFTPIMRILRKTKIFKGLANYIENKINTQSTKIERKEDVARENAVSNDEEGIQEQHAKKKKIYKLFGVFIFVAIPLPLTGVWMGSCLAVALGLNFWETIATCVLGNFVAGIIISTICVMFPNFTHWLIYIFLILVAIFILIEIIRKKLNKSKK